MFSRWILTKDEAQKLFDYVAEKIYEPNSKFTLKFTQEWVHNNRPDRENVIMEEIEHAGGYCDYEVLNKAYPDYNLKVKETV